MYDGEFDAAASELGVSSTRHTLLINASIAWSESKQIRYHEYMKPEDKS
jgi:hypothetical protein